MVERFTRPSRRGFIQASAGAAGAVTLAGTGLPGTGIKSAFAADFPARNIDVVIPTREGGGADRLFRAFTSVWKTHLGADFEPGFYPGASGRVGYEVYIGKTDADGHSLLFGNMGPELAVMVVQEPDYSFPEDFQYFARLDVDPSILFVAADGPFQTIDDVIDAAKERTLNVATSRLPHPASIGALLLAEHTGATFNLVPLSGGRNTIAGVVTGEVDVGVLPSGGVVGAGEALKTLLVWDDNNPMPGELNDAPTINAHYGTSFPPLVSSRAFAIHSKVIEEQPEVFEILNSTAKAAAEDPAWPEAAEAAKQPLEILSYGGIEECNEAAASMIELAERYKGLLTGEG
jgi:tripartite-type tricarboxylate transporter receptor subunit TctC